MAAEVTMPKLTDSMEEGRIVEWKVAPGDRVAEGDVLAEIETDKAVMELESFWAGTVAELLRQPGDVVPVGEVIARVAEQGEATGPSAEAEVPQTEEGGAQAEERAPEGKPEAASPTPDAEALPGAKHGAEAGRRASPEKPKASPPAKAEGEPAARLPSAPEPVPPAPARRGPGGGEVPLPGAHPLSERGGKESPRPAPPGKRPAGAGGAVPATGPAAGASAPGVRASPRARRLARERGVDLSAVAGTGPEGRVTSADVEVAVARAPETQARSVAANRADEELPAVTFAEGEAEVEEVTFYQKASIRRVVASKHVIPHFYVTVAVRADALLARKAAEKGRSGATLTHFLLRACARALERFPLANRSYDRGRWICWNTVNLGLAIQTDAGLVVGVLRDAGGKDLGWLAERTRELVGRAREGKLRPEERRNATFTLSNLGAYDVESFSAIINPPSAMTLAAGSAIESPVVDGGQLAVGTVMRLTLSCDHRVVDGVLGAQFLGEVKRALEEPSDL